MAILTNLLFWLKHHLSCSPITTHFVLFHVKLEQGYSNLAHKINFPAEFSSNSNQTHLSMLINVFRIIRKAQVGEFDQGWR